MIKEGYQLDYSAAARRLKPVVHHTPLAFNAALSRKYACEVYLKREDLQVVRSYKLRGAYHMMSSLPGDVLARGVVCASAGNHAQGFAWSCSALKVRGVVFMPVITPKQKIRQTERFGEGWIEIRLAGDTFDDCSAVARAFTAAEGMSFIPPFDDLRIIEGQSTVGMEILADLPDPDLVFLPVGGGGLCAGAGSYLRLYSPSVRLVGVEPEGAPSLKAAMDAGHPVVLDQIDRFVDGAAVKRVGDLTFEICRDVLNDVVLVPEGAVCSAILDLYSVDAIVAEPAGALTVAALSQYAEQIKGKKVVCLISGGNNDIDRMQEIKERALQYEGLKHYFLIRFAQRPGALKEFVSQVLGPTDDITRFEYMQKHNKETGPALVGIELQSRSDYERLMERMRAFQVMYTELRKDDDLFGYLV